MRVLQFCLVLLAVFGLAARSAQAQGLPEGDPVLKDLQSWWRSTPGLSGGNTLYDVTATRNHGTLIGMGYSTTTGWSPSGRPGGAMQLNFDGVDDYVDTAANTGLTTTTPFTICVWVNATAAATGGVGRFLLRNSTVNTFTGIGISWGDNDAGSQVQRPAFFINSDAGGNEQIRVTADRPLNVWEHLCFTYDGSQTIGGLAIWANGAVAATATDADTGWGTFTDHPWRFGANNNAAISGLFQGAMDEIMVWKRVLSAAEIRQVGAPGLVLDADVVAQALVLPPPVTWNVTTSAELQTAINSAAPGDEIVLANGTYSTTGTGFTWFSATNGLAAAPITIRAANRHQAIIQGDNTCGGSHLGFYMYKQYWIIKDLKFTQVGRAIAIFQSNIEIRNNIIADFAEEGIRVQGTDFPPVQNVHIHHNVIANGAGCANTDSPGIFFANQVTQNTVNDNIVFATGNNGYSCAGVGGCSGTGEPFGYGIYIAVNSDANLIQGNLLFANQGRGVFRILSDEFNSTHSDNNIVRDNAFLWGNGGGDGSDDCSDDSNQFINNLHYGNYFMNWSSKGNINSLKGHHFVQHNLFYATAFTRTNVTFELNTCGGQPIGYKLANTLKDNILYSDGALTGVQDQRTLLTLQGPQASVIAASTNNLFWAPGSTATWVYGYTYDGTDIHATGSPPVFRNEAEGDFALATGSAGRNAASDGTDMGIQYNASLKKSWLRRAFQLPTQLADPVTTSASFTVNPSRYYQIWFYIPTTPFNGIETFIVEGDSRQRDIATLNGNTVYTQPGGPARWITLGRARATDGTLNITWSNASSASKIFIRELPTPDEAYQWLQSTGQSHTFFPFFR